MNSNEWINVNELNDFAFICETKGMSSDEYKWIWVNLCDLIIIWTEINELVWMNWNEK